jgi:hypothetical protein
MGLFNNTLRRKRSQGHRSYNEPISFDSVLPCMNTPLGSHHIRTKLYSVPLKVLNELHEKAKASSYFDSLTPEYTLVYMIRMLLFTHFGTPRIIDECELQKPRKFLASNLTTKRLMLSTSTTSSTIKKHSPVFRLADEIHTMLCISYRYTSMHYCIQAI